MPGAAHRRRQPRAGAACDAERPVMARRVASSVSRAASVGPGVSTRRRLAAVAASCPIRMLGAHLAVAESGRGGGRRTVARTRGPLPETQGRLGPFPCPAAQ